MFLTTLLTEGAEGGAPAASTGMVLIFYIVIFVAFTYFLMIRPQKKQRKQLEDLHASMEPGDSIMTTGGFYGTILDIPDETTVIVEFGNNKNCRIPMHKNAIAEVEKAGSAVVKDEEDDSNDDKKLGKAKK